MEQITIKEIASLCGVGVSTVSRAINNHPDINQETKTRILETIREYAFARSGLEEITFPRKVQKIPSFAFCECRKLKKVLCGANMKEICAWAFDGCGAMEELYYGPHVKVSPMLFESV